MATLVLFRVLFSPYETPSTLHEAHWHVVVLRLMCVLLPGYSMLVIHAVLIPGIEYRMFLNSCRTTTGPFESSQPVG
jgi:hypothetical protein